MFGCRPDGVLSFPDCSLSPSPSRMELQSATMTTSEDRADRVMVFEVGTDTWFRLPKDRAHVFPLELRVSSPAEAGSYECGHTTKPCQATADIVGASPAEGLETLTGEVSVSPDRTLSAQLSATGSTGPGRPCSTISFAIQDVPQSYD